MEPKRVEELFRWFSAVLELRVAGRVIVTTGEHPFFRDGAWVSANELQVGDRLTCAEGSTIVVEGVRDTGDWRPVYNLRVADHHTYFVGDESWGYAVWSHNTCDPEMVQFRNIKRLPHGAFQNNENPNDAEYKATLVNSRKTRVCEASMGRT